MCYTLSMRTKEQSLNVKEFSNLCGCSRVHGWRMLKDWLLPGNRYSSDVYLDHGCYRVELNFARKLAKEYKASRSRRKEKK